jgi:DNA-binding transcriptional regulator YiaG
MPNVNTVLKEEISRISRKEAKAAVAPIRKPSVRYRKDLADLKRRMAQLEKVNRELQARLTKVEGAQPVPQAAEGSVKGWISGKGIKSLRNRLGLSQDRFAKLIGVSAQAVYLWERKTGMLRLRGVTKAKVFSVRGIGAKEAKKRLAEMAAAGKPVKGKKPVRKVKKAASKRVKKG